MKERPWFDQQFVLLVQGAPTVCIFSTLALPTLQVQRGPQHIEQGKYHEANVICVLENVERKMNWDTDGEKRKLRHRLMDRQTNRDKQTDSQTDRHTK